MKIIKVKNHIMYKGPKPYGSHYYALFWNKKYKRYNAIQLTHISKKDEKRYLQADNNIIKPIRIRKLDKYADSGITRANYVSDVNGKPLKPNMGETIIKNVSSTSAKKIKSFANRIYYKGKRY